MAFPVVTPSEVKIEPEVVIPEKVYDKLWMSVMVYQAFDPNADASVDVELVYYRILEDGTKEAKPSSSIKIKLEKLFQRASTDPQLAQLMSDLLIYLIKVGKEQGVVA